jgi:hypothetical protein
MFYQQRNEIDSLQKTTTSSKGYYTHMDCLKALSLSINKAINTDSGQILCKNSLYKECAETKIMFMVVQNPFQTDQAFMIFFDNDFIKAEALARESLEWFEKTNNKNGIENASVNLIFAVFSQSKYDEANTISLKQYEIAEMQMIHPK